MNNHQSHGPLQKGRVRVGFTLSGTGKGMKVCNVLIKVKFYTYIKWKFSQEVFARISLLDCWISQTSFHSSKIAYTPCLDLDILY